MANDALSAFLSRLPAKAVADARSNQAELAGLLDALCARARAAHPALPVAPGALAAAIAERLREDEPVLPPLRGLRVEDLCLALAATAGVPEAVTAFDAMLGAEVTAAAASVRAPATLADEVTQRLRVHLLVGDADRAPGLASYAGRGDLRGFLRIAAVRECLRLLKHAQREVGAEPDDLDQLASRVDPELEQLKETYRGEFETCFREALTRLPARDRTLLRQQVFDGLGIDQLGALYGVHRATAARWLEAARRKLAETTEELLADRLALDRVEVASVVRLVRSQLDVSLRGLLDESRRSG